MAKHPVPALLVLGCLLLGCSAASPPPVTPVVAPHPIARPALSRAIDSLLAADSQFSGVVLVADRGASIYTRAVGFRNAATEAPMRTDAIFELASVSKQFTAMAVMLLAEDGRLRYDDPLERYVPGLPYPDITIRQLLHHTSGLPDYRPLLEAHWDKRTVAGNVEIIEHLIRHAPPRRFAPGERYEYSNTGYVMLGSVIEAASGESYRTFLRRRIFGPLGMRDSDVRRPADWEAEPRFALGYIYSERDRRYLRAVDIPAASYTIWTGGRVGPGRISSTAADLLTWDRALYTEALVPRAALEEAFLPATLADGTRSRYGFGWGLSADSTLGRVVHHTGGNPGYVTVIRRFIESDLTIIILCNTTRSETVTALTARIATLLREERRRSEGARTQ